jgi:hypothetical protein
MIYMIEIDYDDPASEAEWNAWYDGYLRDLVTVPGIDTAQRFRGENDAARKHLAVYTFASLSVYSDPRYAAVGGGGRASSRWKAHISRRRNLYEGLAWVPEVRDSHRLLVTEAEPEALALADVLFVPLEILSMRARAAEAGGALAGQVPFDDDPPRRYVAIAANDVVVRAGVAARNDVAIYRPSSPWLKNEGAPGRRPA